MDKHFDVSKGRDTKILKSLTTAEELSGLLNWALEQLAILRKDGGFKYTQDVDKIRDEWERHTNDVSVFLYEKCTIDVKNTEYQTRTEDLFSAYIKFCGERRSRPLEFSVFGKRLADKGIHNQRKLEYGELVRYYEGVVIGLPKESWQNKPAVFSSFDDRKEENNV